MNFADLAANGPTVDLLSILILQNYKEQFIWEDHAGELMSKMSDWGLGGLAEKSLELGGLGNAPFVGIHKEKYRTHIQPT